MFDMKNLMKLGTIGNKAPKSWAAFKELDKVALEDGAISAKNKELMAIAVALTTQCVYCLEVHKKAAIKAGASEEELAEAAFVAVALRAGAAITHASHLVD